MHKIQYNKLVRDKIPEIIKQANKQPKTRPLKSEGYLFKLAEKLNEEVQEYLTTGSIEELVDVVDVVDAILKHRGISLAEFNTMRKEKNQNRGGFDKKILLEYVLSENGDE